MFAAEPPQEPLPYGRWGEALAEHFAARPSGDRAIGEITWFPDRTWNGRTYVPATAPSDEGFELFGYVSYTREHEGAQAETSRRPTTPTRRPRPTPTGRSTSPTRRSATGAAPRAGAA